MKEGPNDPSSLRARILTTLVFLFAIAALVSFSMKPSSYEQLTEIRKLTTDARQQMPLVRTAMQKFEASDSFTHATYRMDEAINTVNDFNFSDDSSFPQRFSKLKAWFAELEALPPEQSAELWVSRYAHWPVRLIISSRRGGSSVNLWGIDTSWLDEHDIDIRADDANRREALNKRISEIEHLAVSSTPSIIACICLVLALVALVLKILFDPPEEDDD